MTASDGALAVPRRSISALLLCAGIGSRLRPLSDHWPKCLMPVRGVPLLAYWLDALNHAGIDRILVNGHHHAEAVRSFVALPDYAARVRFVHEPQLLGTAATLRANAAFFAKEPVLMVHADNLIDADLGAFIDFHVRRRPHATDFTMMTFDSMTPESCGIVETDERGAVIGFHEKIQSPPGIRANGAVYLLEPSVTAWVTDHAKVTDFSTQVIPHFVGRIATWQNAGVHRDIGTVRALCAAQADGVLMPKLSQLPEWERTGQFAAINREVNQWCATADFSRFK